MKKYFYLVLFLALTGATVMAFWLHQINSKDEDTRESGIVLDAQTEVKVDATIGIPYPTSTPSASPSVRPSPSPGIPQPPVSEEGKFIIYGYGPVEANVNLLGIDVLERTQADSFGYFEFKNLPFPSIFSYYTDNWYPELCLTAVDDNIRQTYPVCIPPLPLSSNAKVIGPIILPPTISLTLPENKLVANQIVAKGKTAPNANVNIFLANSPEPIDFFSIVRTALANYLPKYQLTANPSGNFEFALADANPNTWRMYATSEIIGAPSPKSNTLTFINPSLIMKILLFILNLLAKLRPYWFYIILIIQILIILYILSKYRSRSKVKNRKK